MAKLMMLQGAAPDENAQEVATATPGDDRLGIPIGAPGHRGPQVIGGPRSSGAPGHRGPQVIGAQVIGGPRSSGPQVIGPQRGGQWASIGKSGITWSSAGITTGWRSVQSSASNASTDGARCRSGRARHRRGDHAQQRHGSAHQVGEVKGVQRRAARDVPRAPRRTTVSITWIPATVPTWFMSCCEAAAVPEVLGRELVRRRGDNDGDATPRPSPERKQGELHQGEARGMPGQGEHAHRQRPRPTSRRRPASAHRSARPGSRRTARWSEKTMGRGNDKKAHSRLVCGGTRTSTRAATA